MKYFKCGNCQAIYKIDETKVKNTQVIVTCTKCGAKNSVRFGPTLIVQSKDKIEQFSLKEGKTVLGRKSKNSGADFLIEDEFISRNHINIYIEYINNKYFIGIEDNKSLNGTYNKNKVRLKSNIKYPFLVDDYYIIGLTKLSLKFN